MCDLLIKHCQKGSSVESFAAVIKCTPEVFPIWMRKFPEFEIAMHIAYWTSFRAVEEMGMNGSMHNKTYELIMRNRFNWKNDTESTMLALSKMNTAQLEEMAKRILETKSPRQIDNAIAVLDGEHEDTFDE